MAIESFGRRWRRDKVFWGKGKQKGHLKGCAKNNKSLVIDFREQIGIYVLFDARGEAIYVGQAGIGNKTLFGRLKDHRSDSLRDRWTHFSWFGLRGKNPKTNTLSRHHKPNSWIKKRKRKDALHESEAVLMAVVEPPLNKRGPNWTGTKEFLQYVDDRVPLDVDELVGVISDRLGKLEKKMDKKFDKLLDAN